MFKWALIYGMTSQEFWFGNPQDYFVYQDAFVAKQKLEHDEVDIVAWMYGKYNLLAFSQVYNNAFSKNSKEIYPKEPMSITSKNKKEETLEDAWNKFKLRADILNNKFRK